MIKNVKYFLVYNSILHYWVPPSTLLQIRSIKLMLVSETKHSTVFNRIFCLMFLIDAFRPNVEKKFKPCFSFYANF